MASDSHDLTLVDIDIHEILCHWHLIPPSETNKPQYQAYNLAEHHSIVVTLPDHHIQQLQFIFNQLANPYDLTKSPIRPVAKKPRYDPPQ